MSEVLNSDGAVRVLDDVVPPVLYKSLLDVCPLLGWRYGWRTVNSEARYWHHEVAGGQKENMHDVMDGVRKHPLKVFTAYAEWLRGAMMPEGSRLLRLYLNAHTYGTDGAPHTDTERHNETTFILYLNQTWDPEFGGETVVFDAAGEIEKAVLPRANRILAFPSDRLHAPRPLSKMFGGLRVVLVAKFGTAEEGEPAEPAPTGDPVLAG